MAMTSLPTPPSRDDPINFASRADAFLLALPTFQLEANALEVNVTEKEALAAASKLAAGTFAENALASKNAASDSATSANNSKTNAANSESNALFSKNAAETSKTNAATSEGNALASKNAAGTSAGAAAGFASTATAAASTATTKAGDASTSATSASNSKVAASTSETNAGLSAQAAAASYDSFDDRYLGAKSAVPTLDNDGAALLTGALYFDTSIGNLRVYSGTAWINTPATLAVGIVNTPAGNIAATNVQAALNEIDTKKVALSQLSGMRNRIINGGMVIDQRNAGAVITLTTAVTFITDRFWTLNSSGTGTVTGQQSTLGNFKSYKLTASAAVTTLATATRVDGFNHIIEAQNCFDLNGSNVNVSFQVQTNWAGTLSLCLRNSNATRSYVVDFAVISGTNNLSTTVLLESGTVQTNDNGYGLLVAAACNNEGSFRTATTGAWVVGNFLLSTSATQWTKTTGNFINITNVQIEKGSTATPFEFRPYGMELGLCQRYFEVGSIGATLASNLTSATYSQGGQPFAYIAFHTQKRANPTVTETNASINQATGWGNLGPQQITLDGYGMGATTTIATSSFANKTCLFQASAEL
jgi:hypothetical protein